MPRPPHYHSKPSQLLISATTAYLLLLNINIFRYWSLKRPSENQLSSHNLQKYQSPSMNLQLSEKTRVESLCSYRTKSNHQPEQVDSKLWTTPERNWILKLSYLVVGTSLHKAFSPTRIFHLHLKSKATLKLEIRLNHKPNFLIGKQTCSQPAQYILLLASESSHKKLFLIFVILLQTFIGALKMIVENILGGILKDNQW